MAEIKIDENLSIMKQKLSAVSRDKWPKILAEASTETAFHVRNKLRREMPKYIDKPKPYTLNSLFAKKATPSKLEASVQWRNEGQPKSGGRYLIPSVEGGARPQKRFEKRLVDSGLMNSGDFAVPTDQAPKDAFGNVPTTYLIKTLKALSVVKSDQPVKSRVKGSKQSVLKLFAVKDKRGALSPGIYERVLFFGASAIRKVFSFVGRTSYKKTFPFYQLGTQYAEEKFNYHLDQSIEKSLKDTSNR